MTRKLVLRMHSVELSRVINGIVKGQRKAFLEGILAALVYHVERRGNLFTARDR